MDKQTLVRDMKQACNGRAFITQAGVMRYWGRSKAAVRELLDGLEYDNTGRDYKYFIPDVAERILLRQRQA